MSNYGYQVISENSGALITMESRHDALGLATILDSRAELNYSVKSVEHYAENDLASLVALDER